MKGIVVVPACNEAISLTHFLPRLQGAIKQLRDLAVDIVVIDDGSNDDTIKVISNSGYRLVRNDSNRGLGFSLRRGYRLAVDEGYDFVVTMDADGQHDPADIAGLLKYMPDYDMVVGARAIRDQASVGRAIGNKLYNWLASYVAKFYIQDLTSGFRAIKSKIAKSFLYLIPNTYSYPTTLTLSVLRSGWSLKYIPIKIRARSAR